eukprot:m.1214951 g.1214951  ORF g.1214951 m.1214951 type:complete len:54 (-) comp24606_c0_seq28:519-680(-)
MPCTEGTQSHVSIFHAKPPVRDEGPREGSSTQHAAWLTVNSVNSERSNGTVAC